MTPDDLVALYRSPYSAPPLLALAGLDQVDWSAVKDAYGPATGIPALLRIPIEMHYINELPVKEVASELGLTVAAAKSRLHRGHLYLRDRMLRHTARPGEARPAESQPREAVV